MQNNQLPTKSHLELEDKSMIVNFFFHEFVSSHGCFRDFRICSCIHRNCKLPNSLVRFMFHCELYSSQNIPTEFTHKYGKYVLGFKNHLQGPDGRVMEVTSVKRRQTTSSPQLCFSTGWRAFLLKYQLSLADVLIFSLTAPAFWIVQFVDRSSLSTMD